MVDRRLIAAALLVGAFLPVGNANAQSLRDAYRAALAHDPDYRGVQADADAAGEGEAQARALFRPRIGAQADATFNRTTLEADLPPILDGVVPLRFSGGAFTAGVQAEQPILNGAARAQARQLRAGAAGAEVTLDGARRQLALRVADSYFAVLAADDELASLEAQRASADREQRAAQARFDAGRARITDVREAQARRDAAAAQAVAAAARRANAVAGFNELTGLGTDALARIDPATAPLPPAEPLTSVQARAEAASPLIAGRRLAIEAARARVDQYGWGAQARLDAVGSASRIQRAGSDSRLPFPDAINIASVGMRLQIPLYTGGGLQSQQRQAAAQLRSAEQTLDAARRDTRLTVQQAWTAQSSSVAAIAALRTALASARTTERAAITGREVGIRTQSDVLAAQAQVFDTERRLNDALRDYQRSRLALAVAAGDSVEAALNDIDDGLAEP